VERKEKKRCEKKEQKKKKKKISPQPQNKNVSSFYGGHFSHWLSQRKRTAIVCGGEKEEGTLKGEKK